MNRKVVFVYCSWAVTGHHWEASKRAPFEGEPIFCDGRVLRKGGNRYWQPMVLGLGSYGTAMGGFNKLDKSMVLLLYHYEPHLRGF